jgi:Family of unknown function (DUF6065)
MCQPGWFKRLPGLDRAKLSATNNGLTVKRCVPFLDAISIGWIIPLAATVRLEISDNGREVIAGWEFDREMVSNHGAYQAAGNPYEPRPMMKFHNPWTIRTPNGWSCLFVPPLNRSNPTFECLAGIVDTDTYTSLIHFPFFATGEDGIYVVEKGTPLVQVIPFRRADTMLEGLVRVETKEDGALRERILRSTQAAEGWYRKESRGAR